MKILFLLFATLAGTSFAQDLRGSVVLESRVFPQSPADPVQRGGGVSIAFDVENRWAWEGGRQKLVLRPFLRVDEVDRERTHFDVRELYWQRTGSRWEWSAGFRKLFWGVTESQHLVDVLNQTDLVEDPDGEDKLGQPLASAAVAGKLGRVEVFLLPFFRERSYPGSRGRLRTIPPVGDESGGGAVLDWAARWSHSVGAWDVGVSHFSGTSRDPTFVRGAESLETTYLPLLQTGVDAQLTTGPLLGKVEIAARNLDGDRSAAWTVGLEYTLGDFRGSGVDVGLLAEHLYDTRGSGATTPFENDFFLGTRLAFNDAPSTEVLAGSILDLGSGAAFVNVEGSRRFGARFKLNVTLRAFAGIPDDDPLRIYRRDSYVQTELALHF